MSICSVTVTSDTKATIIGDALRSVIQWVDQCLLVHLVSGDTPDNTLDIARQVAGEKLVIVDTQLAGGMADWRNLGLDYAAKLGHDWACQLDTDERIILNGLDIRAALKGTPEHIYGLTVSENTGVYDKPRFFRLPAVGKFSHVVHEEYLPQIGWYLPIVRFEELPKGPEQVQERLRNDLIGCQKQIEDDPNNPRWHYYYGATLEAAGKPEQAKECYKRSIELLEDGGTIAWTYFCLARCHHNLGQHEQAIEYAALGLRAKPAYAENPWLASIQCVALNRQEDAIAWARLALAHNWTTRKELRDRRIGFKNLVSLFEGPYQVIAVAAEQIGETALQKWAIKNISDAVKARESFTKKGK